MSAPGPGWVETWMPRPFAQEMNPENDMGESLLRTWSASRFDFSSRSPKTVFTQPESNTDEDTLSAPSPLSRLKLKSSIDRGYHALQARLHGPEERPEPPPLGDGLSGTEAVLAAGPETQNMAKSMASLGCRRRTFDAEFTEAYARLSTVTIDVTRRSSAPGRCRRRSVFRSGARRSAP